MLFQLAKQSQRQISRSTPLFIQRPFSSTAKHTEDFDSLLMGMNLAEKQSVAQPFVH